MTARVGVLREGKLCLCGEVNVDKLETTLIPQCIGRAVNGVHGCTCLPWTAEQLALARALVWSGDDHDVLRKAIEKVLRKHREATVPPPVTRTDCFGSHANAQRYFEYDRETTKWIAALSHAEVMGILAGAATPTTTTTPTPKTTRSTTTMAKKTNPKSGSRPKGTVREKGRVITADDFRKLERRAAELERFARDSERRLWASNIMLGALIRQSGGAVDLHREHVVAMQSERSTWEVRQAHDYEAGIHRLSVVVHEPQEAAPAPAGAPEEAAPPT